MAAVVIAGCARVPTRASQGGAGGQPLAHLDVPTSTTAGRVSALLMAAEFALQHKDTATAASDYAQAAKLSRDPRVVRRAVQFAFVANDAAGAANLIKRWQALGAGPHALASARARLAMLHGDRAAARQQFAILLASGNPVDWQTFAADLLAARDRALAGVLLESLATPKRLPADENLWIALSQLGEHLGRHAFARKLADAAVQRFHGAAAIVWAANLRVAMGDRAGALSRYAKGVRAHPHNVDLRLGYAALLADAGKHSRALAVLASGPQTTATWSARVAYAARANDTPALQRLYAALRHAPATQRTRNVFLLGQLAELLKHEKQALRWYGEVDPDSDNGFEAQVRSALLLDKTGHQAEAHTLARQLQRNNAEDTDNLRTAYQLEAELYSRDGKHALAVATFNRGLVALPDDPGLIYGRGIEEAEAGKTDAALKDFRKVLKLKPDDVEAMNALGYTLADANRDLPEATQLLRRALAKQPEQAAIMDSWGWLQYRLGHLDQALTWLHRAWNKGAQPEVGVHLGEVLWKLGHHQRASEVFAKVRKLDPDNAALQRVLRKLQP